MKSDVLALMEAKSLLKYNALFLEQKERPEEAPFYS